MKKAMMFSILTIMLIGLIIMLSMAFIQRGTFTSELHSDGFISSQFSRLHSTIAHDYIEISGVDILDISSENMNLKHSFEISENEHVMEPLLNEYINYFENYFAPSQNIYSELNLEPYFFIQPFNYSFKRSNNYYDASLGKELDSISLKANLSENEYYLNKTDFTYENGSTLLELVLYDNLSNKIFEFENHINISRDNSFNILFNSSEPKPNFHIDLNENNLNMVARNRLNASVNLIYEFTSDKSKIYLNTGTSTRLESTQKDFSKEEPITLMTG